jgi:hypothetical protein
VYLFGEVLMGQLLQSFDKPALPEPNTQAFFIDYFSRLGYKLNLDVRVTGITRHVVYLSHCEKPALQTASDVIGVALYACPAFKPFKLFYFGYADAYSEMRFIDSGGKEASLREMLCRGVEGMMYASTQKSREWEFSSVLNPEVSYEWLNQRKFFPRQYRG